MVMSGDYPYTASCQVIDPIDPAPLSRDALTCMTNWLHVL